MTTASLIAAFGEPVTVQRRAPGTWLNGLWVEGIVTSIPAVGSIQPMTGADLLNLPELMRTREVYKGYFSIPVYTATETASPDTVVVGGRTYEVQNSQGWNYDFQFWKVTLVRLNV